MSGPRPYEICLRQTLVFNTLAAVTVCMLNLCFDPSISWRHLLESFLSSMVFANVIGTTAAYLIPKFWPLLNRLSPAWKWSSIVALLVAVGTAGALIASLVVAQTGMHQNATFRDLFWDSVRISILITLLFGGASTFYESMRQQLELTTLELRTRELERERALKVATEARLSSLESRIHPHFLFNALNSISSLIPEDPLRAERLIEQMAALLRFSLDSTRSGCVPLSQEMKIVRDYLEIEKARFGDRLSYRLSIPAEMASIEIPPLSVQTLVENSVKYAVSPRREGGKIVVEGSHDAGRIRIKVIDDGPGFTVESMLASHGLDNLQSRLLTLYGMDASLALRRTASGMEVTISVPLEVSQRIPS